MGVSFDDVRMRIVVARALDVALRALGLRRIGAFGPRAVRDEDGGARQVESVSGADRDQAVWPAVYHVGCSMVWRGVSNGGL